jgi:putative flippase GtrA
VHATLTQFLKFAAGGAVGTALHYAVLVAWVEVAGGPVVPGTLAGFCVGALANYLIARRYVFVTARSHVSAVPRFALVAAVGAAINTAIVALLYRAGAYYLAAQVAATGVVLVFNFLANRHWTFSR